MIRVRQFSRLQTRQLILALGITIFVLSGCRSPFGLVTPVKEDRSAKGMVVTAHPLATEVGLHILKKGGNAFDAAVGVHYALAVVYPRAGNLGGGGFAVLRTGEGNITTLDFREKAPGRADRDMYLDEDGNVIDGLSLKGGLAVGIPGAVDGMATLHKAHGKMPMKTILSEVILLADRGFTISEEEAGRLNGFKKAFQEWNTEAIPFVKDEEWSTGDVLRQTALAKTLKGISRHGADYFYSGTAAQHLVDRIQKKGGIATMDDLANYESVWRDPIVFEYEGHEVYSMPPPSSGGTTLAQILTMYGMIKGSGGLDPNVHALVEAERRAFADRASFLGDPDYVQVPLDTLLNRDYLRRRISDFEPGQASSSEEIKEGIFDWSRESFETTHYCVADKDGNVASVTTTLNSNFGSKVFVPELGFFLNNEMDDFSAKPGVPNQFGLIGNEMNAIAPGKRMLSSMTPTIVEKDGDFFLALGTPGGSTIITTVAQVMLRVIDDEASLLDAVSAPRFHHQWWPDVVMHEEDLAPSLKVDLSNRGHQLRALQKLGLVEAILHTSEGAYIGVADPRSDDHAAGVK